MRHKVISHKVKVTELESDRSRIWTQAVCRELKLVPVVW